MRRQARQDRNFLSIFPILICFMAAILSSPDAEGQDLKDVIDANIRTLRACQNQDGTYGNRSLQPDATALVLLAMANSPRRYTDIDGPFMRKAAQQLIARQREDGSMEPAGHGDVLRSTSLASAALRSVNASGNADSVERALKFLVRQVEKAEDPIAPETCFALCLALENSHAPLLGSVSVRCGDGPLSPLYRNLCRVLGNEKIGSEFVRSWRERLERDARAPDAPALSPPGLLGACTLFLALEKTGSPPLLWADRMTGIATSWLVERSSEPTEKRLVETALIAASLSACYESTQKAARQAAPHDEAPPLPDIVAAPLPLEEALDRALEFCGENQRSGKFGFGGYDDPGITGMALSAVIRSSRLRGRTPPAYVEQGLVYLESLQKEDGSVFLTGLKTYVTSVALMAFADSKDPAYEEAIARARDFLVAVQADEGEGYSMEEDPFYGGLGYGGDERPDLSNTQMALDALRTAGLDAEHEAFQKALNFIKKCQNEAESNPTEVILSDGRRVVAGTDGGGIYYPGDSKAGVEEVDKGVYVARSYGSMTYALLKSLIFTGLDPEDKRVKAAVKWVENHYTLEENPGFEVTRNPEAGQQGLFYYYLTMARALDALGDETITDAHGKAHPWKKELARKILSLQRVDGSWINERSPRWFEGNPVLATSYALLVLDICAL